MEADQVRLDFQLLFAKGRIAAHVDGRRPALPGDKSAAAIDARRRQQRVNAGHVRGGKAKPSAAARPVRHNAANTIGLRQQTAGVIDLPGGDLPPDARTGNDFSPADDRLDNLQIHAAGAGQFGQYVDGARAVAAETEIGAFDHGPRGQLVSHHPLKKLAVGQGQQRFVRGIGDEAIHAQLRQQLRFAIGPGQRPWRPLRPQQPRRVRIEGENDRGAAHVPRQREQTLHESRVSQMNAVEVADGQCPAAYFGGRRGEFPEKFHASIIRPAAPTVNRVRGGRSVI